MALTKETSVFKPSAIMTLDAEKASQTELNMAKNDLGNAVAEEALNRDDAITRSSSDIMSSVSESYATKTALDEVDDTATSALDRATKAADDSADFRATVTSYMRFDTDGLELGKSGERSTTRVDNVGTHFLWDGTEVARVGSDGEGGSEMEIANANVTDQLRIGNWVLVARANGNLAIKWIGGTA